MERHEVFMLYFGTDWKHMRESNGRTVTEIAEATGLSRPTVYDLENRKPTCSEKSVRAFLTYWGQLK